MRHVYLVFNFAGKPVAAYTTETEAVSRINTRQSAEFGNYSYKSPRMGPYEVRVMPLDEPIGTEVQ